MADGDLNPEEERQLSGSIKEKTGHEFVFVTDYPKEFRAFYHMRHADDPTITKGFDLLFDGLEITTGAQREHRYDVLIEQAKEKGLKLDSIKFYLDFFNSVGMLVFINKHMDTTTEQANNQEEE